MLIAHWKSKIFSLFFRNPEPTQVITRFPHYDVGRTVMALEIACGGIEVNQ
jgi:hypothetical protein